MTNSVHLTDFPKVETQSIHKDLSDAMNKVQTVVTLWLARRARNKIRVRQPLQTITIGFELEEHFNEIIRDELNIKQIVLDKSINQKVTKICKPNARLIGPKYGKDVQKIIQAGKAGDFVEQEDGSVKIEHRVLQAEEFEFDYVKTDETLDVEAADGMVIAIDPVITPELEAEGYARDLVRFIQEARKEANYNIDDRIQLGVENWACKIEEFFGYIQEETLSTLVEELSDADLEKEVELGDFVVKFKIKK